MVDRGSERIAAKDAASAHLSELWRLSQEAADAYRAAEREMHRTHKAWKDAHIAAHHEAWMKAEIVLRGVDS